MKLKIRKNRRKPFPFFYLPIPILINKNKSFSIIRYFKFDESAIYFFNDNDQYNVNKLFGFSIGFHHNNSVRFGWRPNNDLTKIEIVGYEYVNKVRVPTIPICEVNLNQWYEYKLRYIEFHNQIEYSVKNVLKHHNVIHPITLKRKFNLGYKLYLYFGGNKKTPHDIIIYCRR